MNVRAATPADAKDWLRMRQAQWPEDNASEHQYVDPEVRRRGVGRALIAAAERWALAQGCTEFGSDALIDNEGSLAAHQALGFQETSRVCCFRRNLTPESLT